jgi:hypothetical protein
MMQGIEFVFLLLAVAAALQFVTERYLIPRPVLLVMGGLILAVTPGLPRLELNRFVNLNPVGKKTTDVSGSN